ncbi:hypothetical protein AVEN_127851-1 [Araneus ventricosus]|uniref:Uncharacterized protein n=1 Tax=Araneus ventricosus TaxID=182803 RepID=A0A4Y2A0L2_ARAVE|nr:hypothetical protein AVEN_127851-1 [Araneus ventricosus]
MIHYLFRKVLQGVRPTEDIEISLPMKQMSVQEETQKVEEEHLRLPRQYLECIKGVITKRLKFESFRKSDILTLMMSIQTSKENILQRPAHGEIYVGLPSEKCKCHTW